MIAPLGHLARAFVVARNLRDTLAGHSRSEAHACDIGDGALHVLEAVRAVVHEHAGRAEFKPCGCAAPETLAGESSCAKP